MAGAWAEMVPLLLVHMMDDIWGLPRSWRQYGFPFHL